MKREPWLVYGITERSYLSDMTLYEACRRALEGGITMLQLREKNMDEEALAREIPPLLDLCHRYSVPLILDDHVELAKKLGCDGVHVGQNDMPADEARHILGPDSILGVTAKSVAQAQKAEADGADYLGSGAMFVTSTKPEARAMTKETLTAIAESVSIPVVAIGGITHENVRELKDCKIAGVAVSEAIFHQKDIAEAARSLKKQILSDIHLSR